MATITTSRLPASRLPPDWTLADLQRQLGGIPLDRIRLVPPPGYGTEADVLEIEARENRLCELQNGVLVEKPMGWYESLIASLIVVELGIFLKTHDLGKVLGPDGSLKILPETVKIPDVSFISWQRWPKERLPRTPVPQLVPDLAIEVLSETNTAAEMDDKVRSYFRAGVQLVWLIDPQTRSARAFTDTETVIDIGPDQSLDGAAILPGFRLSLVQLFENADRQSPR